MKRFIAAAVLASLTGAWLPTKSDAAPIRIEYSFTAVLKKFYRNDGKPGTRYLGKTTTAKMALTVDPDALPYHSLVNVDCDLWSNCNLSEVVEFDPISGAMKGRTREAGSQQSIVFNSNGYGTIYSTVDMGSGSDPDIDVVYETRKYRILEWSLTGLPGWVPPVQVPPTVPLPASSPLILAGLGALAFVRRQRHPMRQ